MRRKHTLPSPAHHHFGGASQSLNCSTTFRSPKLIPSTSPGLLRHQQPLLWKAAPSQAVEQPNATSSLPVLLLLGHTHPQWRNNKPSLVGWPGQSLPAGAWPWSTAAPSRVSSFSPPLSVALLPFWSSLKIILIFLDRGERKGSREGIAAFDH